MTDQKIEDTNDIALEQAEENKLIAQRKEKLASLREQGLAYPNDVKPSYLAIDIQNQFADKSKEELADIALGLSIAGRVMLNRGAFIVIQDTSSRIQFYVNRKALSKDTLTLIKSLDLGDIVYGKGLLAKSGKGDLYVDLAEFKILTKSLRPLPDKHKGLADVEMKYRQRYVDLIVNDDTRKTFMLRSKLVQVIRNFLTTRDYLEVETPMLQSIPGGASARPFTTHHNALDMELFMRIAPELYLKRLVVGGFDRVFEINRNFRNEGLSTRHNPEFTMLEFYQAYATYHDLMDITEQMFKEIALTLCDSTTVLCEDVSLDFGKPFERLSIVDSIVQYNKDITIDQVTNENTLDLLLEKNGITVKSSWGKGKKQMELFEAVVEEKLMQPTFITEYPTEVSPLARVNDDNPEITDRFELFICGREIANGFSELNDPQDQAERFAKQVAEKDAGDDEAMHFDSDYITALEYGMPPTAGQGIGIDRLAMLFTNSPSIRDVILFPLMRTVKE